MIRKHRTVICREGWYYLMVLAFVVGGALMREINLLLLIAGMMVGTLLYNWRDVIASLRGLEVQRRLPTGICAGDLLVVDLTLKNKSRRYGSWAIVVEDQVAREHATCATDGGRGAVLFPSVPPGASRRLSYYGRLCRRGRYHFGPLRISTRFPLGWIRRTITVDRVQTITVGPRLGRLTSAWSSLHQRTPRGARTILRQSNTLDGDFFGLRDWHLGDSRRAIHWRTSARRGSLVVRQSQQQRQQDVLLLVDLWQPRRCTPEHRRYVEQAVSFAATVVADLCRHGASQLDVGIAGTELSRSRGTTSMARLGELMDQFAVAEASADDHRAELLRWATQVARPGSVTLLVSTRPAERIDGRRPADLVAGAGGRSARAKIATIDASSAALNKYFTMD